MTNPDYGHRAAMSLMQCMPLVTSTGSSHRLGKMRSTRARGNAATNFDVLRLLLSRRTNVDAVIARIKVAVRTARM